MAASLVNALLWAGALAATIWILVPAIAFALKIGGLRTEILPDAGPPTLYAEDSVFGPRLREFAAIGFRMEARIRERGRFVTPAHWSWQSYAPAPWLISPDRLTHASLYRLIADEPARISTITMFDDGGFVRTSCPGVAGSRFARPNFWRLDLRGVDAAELFARHQEQVEEYARERGARPKAATVAEITAAENAAQWPLVRKVSASDYAMTAMFLCIAVMALPLLFAGARQAHAGVPGHVAPLMILAAAGFFAFWNWVVRGLLRRHFARRSHSEDLVGVPADIAEDGTILATGKNERRLRLLAATAAVVACAWPMTSMNALPRILRERPGAIVPWLLFLSLGVLTVVHLIWRARGKLLWFRKRREEALGPWAALGITTALFVNHLEWSRGTLHRVLFFVGGLLVAIAIAGWRLEKKRGQ